MEITKHTDLYCKELKLVNYTLNTINSYNNCVKLFLLHFNKYPERINESEIKDYLLNLKSTSLVKQNIGALKLFYKLVVKQPLKFKYIEYPRKEAKLPNIYSIEEVKRLISVIKNKKHLAIVSLLYGCGLRVSEVINLKIKDIDKHRKIINIRQGKGNKDRQVPYPDNLKEIIKEYYLEYNPKTFLFNGQSGLIQYSETSIRQFLNKYRNLAKISKPIHPHLLRHSCFTHLVESGIDISIVQELAGHKDIKTTNIYKHLSTKFISNIRTPLENIF